MPRYCVDCSPNGAICDFCRFAAHNAPDAPRPHLTPDTFCGKHGRAVTLEDDCEDFECFLGDKLGWRVCR